MTVQSVVVDKQALIEDAKNRFDRTFFQGLAIDVVVALAVAVYAIATDPNPIVWAAVGASLLRTVAQASASYVMRRFIDAKTGKLLPPAPQPAPAEIGTETPVMPDEPQDRAPTGTLTPEAALIMAKVDPHTPPAAHIHPDPDDLDTPEPEQHTQILTGAETDVVVYPDQSPHVLDDADDLPEPGRTWEPKQRDDDEETGEPA